jgi:tetratricopeptide (TPR) repeat protein
LRSLSKQAAETVGKHLLAAGMLLDEDPAAALEHARAARARASRIGVVRETVGYVAYSAGEWAEALSDLRAAKRITGSSEYLPVIADCERALGRPERALDLARSPETDTLSPAGQAEMLIVSAGARRDLDQLPAAIALLRPAATGKVDGPWVARVQYVYADALLAAGQTEEAVRWFGAAAENDDDEETDAADRLAEMLDSGELDSPGLEPPALDLPDEADLSDEPDLPDQPNGE